LGCGHGDVGAAFHRLGAEVTCVDARNEHLKITAKKYPGIKTVNVDLDKEWKFNNFDVILDLGVICHLRNFENHLRNVCNSANYVVIETAVCDSDDPCLCPVLTENKAIYDWSFNGFSSRPTAAFVEKIITESGFEFKKVNYSNLNLGKLSYDWTISNSGTCDSNKRRFWIAKRNQPALVSQPALAMVGNPGYHSPGMQLTPATHTVRNISTAAPPTPLLPSHSDFPSRTIARKSYSSSFALTNNKKFVIVIPSYNNQKWCEQNINSALNQEYGRFRVIFTDDCSTDGTFEKVSAAVNASEKSNKCTLIKNTTRKGALQNLYEMIHSCDDDEIILTLDGDDWFPHNNVLSKLRDIYSQFGDVWMTYGQYQNYPDGGIGIAQPYPTNIVDSNSFRSYQWCASHLRTFYAWLFKNIKKEDFLYNGNFFPMTWDMVMMFPMLEMAGTHAKFNGDILYMYNLENPINDHKVNVQLQQDLDRYVRKMPKYSRCAPPPPKKPDVGLLIIATGKYHTFVQGLISSADKYFLNDICNVTYYVFTDNNQQIHSTRNVTTITIDHKAFPFASMDRFKHFVNNANKFDKEEYLYYVDVDCLFVDNVSDDILGHLVGVRHCGFYNKIGPYETNKNSTSYVEPNKYKYYFGGGFSGGRKENYLELAKWCSDMLEADISKDIMPIWHDESILNKYFSDHIPDVVLDPSFHYPQSNIEYYKKMWKPNDFRPKILLLEKQHDAMR